MWEARKELYRTEIREANGDDGKDALPLMVSMEKQYPGELCFTFTFPPNDEDVDLWFAEELAVANVTEIDIKKRAEQLSQRLIVKDIRHKKNESHAHWAVYFDAMDQELNPRLTIVGGCKVAIRKKNKSLPDHPLYGQILKCKRNNRFDVLYADGSRDKNVDRQDVLVFGRRRPGRFDTDSADIAVDMETVTNDVIDRGMTMPVHQLSYNYGEDVVKEVVKIQSSFRRYLAKKATKWFRGKETASPDEDSGTVVQQFLKTKPQAKISRNSSFKSDITASSRPKVKFSDDEDTDTEPQSDFEQSVNSQSVSSLSMTSSASQSSNRSSSDSGSSISGSSSSSSSSESGSEKETNRYQAMRLKKVEELTKKHNANMNMLASLNLSALGSPEKLVESVASSGKVTLFILTFNTKGGLLQPQKVMSLLHGKRYHFYFIAFQKVSLDDAGYDELAEKVVASLGRGHVLLAKEALHGLLLVIIADIVMLPLVSDVRKDFVQLGAPGIIKSESGSPKGATAISFKIADKTIACVNAHLKGGIDCVQQRNANYREINARLKIPSGHLQSTPLADRVDFCFFVGELNYFVSGMDSADYSLALYVQDFPKLLQYDQMWRQQANGNAFKGYVEGHIDFPPTSRFKSGSNAYDFGSKGNRPSWTSRILYAANNDVESKAYEYYKKLRTSPYRPVWGLFRLKIDEPDGLWESWTSAQKNIVKGLASILDDYEIEKPKRERLNSRAYSMTKKAISQVNLFKKNSQKNLLKTK